MRVFYVAVLGCVLVGCGSGEADLGDGMGGFGGDPTGSSTGGMGGNGANLSPDACGPTRSDCEGTLKANTNAIETAGAKESCKLEIECDEHECFLLTQDHDGDGFRADCEGLTDLPYPIRTSLPSDDPSKKNRRDCDDGRKYRNPDGTDAASPSAPDEVNCAFFEDNDCNGELSCDCKWVQDDPATIPCYLDEQGREIQFLREFYEGNTARLTNRTKPPGTCAWGHRECVGEGRWGACVGAVGVRQEACHYDGNGNRPVTGDGNDDYDCDGILAQDEALDEAPTSSVLGLTSFFCDADRDGWIAPNTEAVEACSEPLTAECGDGSQTVEWREAPPLSAFDDCNDADKEFNPDAKEVCDGFDNDCDTSVDEDLTSPEDLSVASYQCDGGWIPTCNAAFLNCNDKDSVCETPQSITDCGGCDVACAFSCATEETLFACDEVTKFAVGAVHACAVTEGGRASCWGRGKAGELGSEIDKDQSGRPLPVSLPADVGAERRKVTAIAVGAPASSVEADGGGSHTCAIVGPTGEVFCWGAGAHGQNGQAGTLLKQPGTVLMVETSPAVSIALGSAHSGIANENGSVLTWGDNSVGQLGHGGTNDTVNPGGNFALYYAGNVDKGAITDAIQVSAYAKHTCVVTERHTVMCAGDNDDGQLGTQSGSAHIGYFDEIQGLTGVLDVQTGLDHTCALLESGQVECWGANTQGQLGNGGFESGPGSATRFRVVGPEGTGFLGDVTSLSLGSQLSCALSGGKVYCWGINSGEFGVTNPPVGYPDTLKPTLNPLLSEVTQFGIRGSFGCARTTSQPALECWGGNNNAQLGRGGMRDNDMHVEPLPISVLLEGGI